MRVTSTWNSLSQHEPQQPTALLELDWRTSGSKYGLPAIRKRPKYTKIVNDQGLSQKDRVNDRIGRHLNDPEEKHCNKFYDAEKQLRMNGGIMVLWCPHAVCLGFHIIKTGEGRDDVFSALYTRWVSGHFRASFIVTQVAVYINPMILHSYTENT